MEGPHIHIYTHQERLSHVLKDNCHCEPFIEELEDATVLVIHNLLAGMDALKHVANRSADEVCQN